MTWSHRRQLIYLIAIVLFFALIASAVYFVYKPAPTCYDGKKNGDELGIDCGGSCSHACAIEALPLKILWSRALPLGNGLYDVTAMIKNDNSNLGLRQLAYEVRLYDANNVLLAKREGLTFVNPGEQFVVFESRIDAGISYPVTRTFISFANNLSWEKISSVPPTVLLTRKEFTNGNLPSLHFQVANNSLKSYGRINFVAVLSDINQNAFAASATFVEQLESNETKDIFFTWPTSFAELPSYVNVYPRINVFSLETEN